MLSLRGLSHFEHSLLDISLSKLKENKRMCCIIDHSGSFWSQIGRDCMQKIIFRSTNLYFFNIVYFLASSLVICCDNIAYSFLVHSSQCKLQGHVSVSMFFCCLTLQYGNHNSLWASLCHLCSEYLRRTSCNFINFFPYKFGSSFTIWLVPLFTSVGTWFYILTLLRTAVS